LKALVRTPCRTPRDDSAYCRFEFQDLRILGFEDWNFQNWIEESNRSTLKSIFLKS
jgi:hypothetical protein